MLRTLLSGLAAIAASGCTANAILVATDDYTTNVPGAIAAVEDILVAEESVSRQRGFLGWYDAPASIVKNSSLDVVGAVCKPGGSAQIFALGELRDYSSATKGIGKAPKDGLMPALSAINDKQARLKKINDDAAKAGKKTLEQKTDACKTRVTKLYNDKPAIVLRGATPIYDTLVAVYDALTATAKLFEQETRAELIVANVNANRIHMRTALCLAIEADPAKPMCTDPNTPFDAKQGQFKLQAYVDDHLRYLLTVAGTEWAAISAEPVDRKLESASRAADALALIDQLLPMDADADLFDPLIATQLKFEAAVLNPKLSLDDFMKSIEDLKGARDKWVKARDDWRAARN